jgi:hypothetical protein
VRSPSVTMTRVFAHTCDAGSGNVSAAGYVRARLRSLPAQDSTSTSYDVRGIPMLATASMGPPHSRRRSWSRNLDRHFANRPHVPAALTFVVVFHCSCLICVADHPCSGRLRYLRTQKSSHVKNYSRLTRTRFLRAYNTRAETRVRAR